MTEKEIKSILGVSICNEIAPLIPIAAQAATWGASSALASKLTQDKGKTKKQKRKNLRNLAISGALGAAAGGLGQYLSSK